MDINGTPIGPGYACYIIAEIGINHNGDFRRAIELMQAAKYAGAQAVKFQKRTLELTVPEDKRNQIRYDTPWGDITYWNYKQELELSLGAYEIIREEADSLGIDWFASPWDSPSVDFLQQLNPHAMKVASAGMTDENLVARIGAARLPVILSTGMCDMDMVKDAVSWVARYDATTSFALLQCTAVYPSSPETLNLRVMHTLREEFKVPVGFSNHSPGLTHCQNAVALGADIVEAHITLDRAGWGSDQASSIEPHGFRQMIGRIRSTELALGDGIKRIYPAEAEKMGDLRP